MQIPIKPLSRFYDIFVISLSAGAFVTVFVPQPTAQNSSFFTTLTWIFIYFVTLIRTVHNRHRLRAIVLGSLPVMCLVGICCMSVLWSIGKGATIHAAFSLAVTTLIAIDFGFRYTPEEFLKTMSKTLIILIAIGILTDLFFHGLIPDDDFDQSTFHGVFGTKNAYGRLVVLSLTAFLSLPNKSKVVTFLYICATYAVLAGVHSTGALVNCTIMLVVFAASVSFRWDRRARQSLLIALPFVVGAAIYAATSNLATVTTSVGKDPSLTGRTVLWRMAIRSIFNRPLLGYGYSAFWNKDSQIAWRIRQQANWLDAPHAHNGYIDLPLGIGLVGLFILLTVYISVGRNAYRYAVAGKNQISKWPLIYLIYFIDYQFAETTLVGGNSIFWILLIMVSIQVAGHQKSDVPPAMQNTRTYRQELARVPVAT